MSDYTPITDFSAKDALTTGDAEKIISGADIDAETAAIQTAIATKYDSNDVASQEQAEAVGPGASNSVLMTPLATYYVLNENAGALFDIQGLTDPGADRILFWDDVGTAGVTWLTVGDGLEISTTTLQLPSSLAGNGLTLTSGVLAVVGGNGITANANDIALTDQAASTTVPVSLSSGTLGFDITALTDFGTTAGVDLDTDTLIVSDGPGTNKEILASQLITPEGFATVATTADTLAETDFGKMIDYSSTSTTTITLPNGLKTGFWCVLRKTGATGDVTISAATTLQTANSLTTWSTQYAAVTVMHIGSNVWAAWGALES